jgi:hypothetical protein
MSHLLSCSPLAIKQVADALDVTIPPVVLTDSTDLQTEEDRLRLAQKIGRREVVDLLKLAFKKHQENN